jgi:hypothetical protein
LSENVGKTNNIGGSSNVPPLFLFAILGGLLPHLLPFVHKKNTAMPISCLWTSPKMAQVESVYTLRISLEDQSIS